MTKETVNSSSLLDICNNAEDKIKLAKHIVRSVQLTKWKEPKTGKLSPQVQVNLSGLTQIKLYPKTEADFEVLKRLVPGRAVLFSFLGHTTKELQQRGVTQSGGEDRTPVKITTYTGIEIVAIGKAEPTSVVFDDDASAVDELHWEEREGKDWSEQTGVLRGQTVDAGTAEVAATEPKFEMD